MKDRREPVVLVIEGNAEKRNMRNAADAGIAVGQVDPVDEDESDDLAERQRDDRQIVASEPQDRKSENDAPRRGERSRQRQADPERQAESRRQQRIRVGADRVKGRVSEVKQAGEADDDIQSPAQHHVDHDLNAVIVDPLERAGWPKEPERDEGEQREDAKRKGAEITSKSDPGARRRRDALAFARRLHQRAARAAGGDRADAVEPYAPVGPRHLAQENENEDDRRNPERKRPSTAEHELVVDVRFGMVADDRKRQAEGDACRGRRRAKRWDKLPSANDGFGKLRGLRRRGHAQTFSTSGRPRMPEGRNIKVMARIMNAATSL